MAINWEKLDKTVDIKGMQKDIKEAAERSGDYKEVPHGTYEVKIDKLELVQSKKGDPMLTVWFTILEGEYKNSKIFMNQVCTQPFQIHLVHEFLRSLESRVEIPEFNGYSNLNETILDVHEAINKKLEYQLKYSENKGYNKFEIEDVFEA